jgi:hypothetical protein
VAVGPAGQPWIVDKSGAIFRRTPGQTSYVDGAWEVVPGQATAIGIGADGAVWAIGVLQGPVGGNLIYHNSPSRASGWDQEDGAATGISVAADGQPWLVNKDGAIFARSKGWTGYVDGTWTVVAQNGAATVIAAGGAL